MSFMSLLAKCDALVACVAGGSAYAKTIIIILIENVF